MRVRAGVVRQPGPGGGDPIDRIPREGGVAAPAHGPAGKGDERVGADEPAGSLTAGVAVSAEFLC